MRYARGMRPFLWVGVVLGVVLVSAGCGTRNTEYYCDNQADCDNGVGGVCDIDDHVCRTVDGANGDGANGDGSSACNRTLTWQRLEVDDAGPHDLEIWASDVDGANAHALTMNDQDDGVPRWSPDGSHIAFTRASEIWVMNADGSDQHSITQGPDSNPRWSPDSAAVAYVHTVSGMNAIWAVQADGTGATPLTPTEADDLFFDWSPDGAKIAFRTKRDGNFEVYVMGADGSAQTNVSNDGAADGGDVDGEIRWAPDGSRIAFVSDRVSGNPDLWSITPTGIDPADLNALPSGYDLAGFNWSPDSSSIIFGRSMASRGELHVMFADGSGEHAITTPIDPERLDFEPAYSSDGLQITWTRLSVSGTLKFEVFVADADGTNPVRISNSPGKDSGPSFRPCR